MSGMQIAAQGAPPSSTDIWPPEGIALLNGPNFSGRTSYLQAATGYGNETQTYEAPRVYVGPEVYNTISGLATTVGGEIALHDRRQLDKDDLNNILDDFGLNHLLDSNPFKLSGGEQVCLVAAAKFLLNPQILALDCVFEQLHEERRDAMLRSFRGIGHGFLTIVADNRPEDFEEGFWSGVVDIKHVVDQTLEPPIKTPCAVPLDDLPTIIGCRLTLREISFNYGRRNVLDDLTVELHPGEIYCLEGKNGAGKSTLAKLLAGTLKVGSGVIERDGHPFRPDRCRGNLVSYHFQNPDLQLFSNTVLAELQSSSNGDRERVEKVIEAFDLRGSLDKHPLDLSFVVRKRVALAASLCSPAPWVILDEPTLGQDEATAEALRSMVFLLAKKGHGVIVISHSRSFRDRLQCGSLTLEDGTIRRDRVEDDQI